VRGLAYVMRGNFYRDFRGDIDRAMADYAAAFSLDPDDLLAYNSRGDTFRAVGDFDHAIADYDRIIALLHADRTGPNDATVAVVFRNRAEAFLGKGDADRAIADYDAMIRVLPHDARALYGRGLAKARKGDRAGGEADVASAKAITPAIAEELSRSGLK
jgi:tetratricopeptide (TPR) repeat protein